MSRAITTDVVMLLIICLVPQYLFCQEELVISAKIWPYKSLCEFKDPPHISGFMMKFDNARLKVSNRDCEGVAQAHPKMTAVCITLSNTGQSQIEIPYDPSFSATTLTSTDGLSYLPLASRDLAGGPRFFITECAGSSYLILLRPKEDADFVYFFQSAKAGDTIIIGKLKPVKIQ
jgi:hypothetical protein